MAGAAVGVAGLGVGVGAAGVGVKVGVGVGIGGVLVAVGAVTTGVLDAAVGGVAEPFTVAVGVDVGTGVGVSPIVGVAIATLATGAPYTSNSQRE